jgi:drug/metabolite transporter (DMT)-like permease
MAVAQPAAPSARPLDAAASAIMVVLCLSWGFNQVAVKLTLGDIPPLMQATIRSIGALGVIVLWARLRGVPLTERDGTLWAGMICGALFAAEFILIYRALVWTTASRAALFLYTAPFFVALGARWLLPGEKLAVSQWVGLGLSFLGLVVAFGVPTADRYALIGDAMMVGAGLMWGATTLVIKGSALGKVSAEKALAWQLLVSIPLLALATALVGERIDHAPGAVALSWLAYQTFWVVSITFAIWFALVKRYSASRLSAFTFLTPLFGVTAGHLVMGDALTPGFLVSVALVVTGLVLVNRPR